MGTGNRNRWDGASVDGDACQCEGGWVRNNARHLKCQRNGKLIPPFVTQMTGQKQKRVGGVKCSTQWHGLRGNLISSKPFRSVSRAEAVISL